MADARIDPLVRSFERSLRAERKSERTIKTYFEALEQLSALLHERGRGLADATTADIQKPPAVPEDPVPVLDDEALRRLFETCEGRGFDERRDTAILHLFLDGGPAKPTAASRRWIGCKERVLATGPRRRLLIR